MENDILIRSLRKAETGKALRLVKKVFWNLKLPITQKRASGSFSSVCANIKVGSDAFIFPKTNQSENQFQ